MARFHELCAGAAIFLAACAGPEATPRQEQVQKEQAQSDGYATVKPGAAIFFTHTLREPVEPGGAGVLQLTVTEKYAAGAMRLEASSRDLEIASSSQSSTMQMDGATTHQWDIYFDAPLGGVHYIDIIATAEEENGSASSRSYSAIVPVGDNASAEKTAADVQRDAAGTPVVVMDAQETIEE